MQSYTSNRATNRSTLEDIHLEDCIFRDRVEERRVKYLDSWASTFREMFHIKPPTGNTRGAVGRQFKRMHAIEFFLWSDISPQPTFDYVKQRTPGH